MTRHFAFCDDYHEEEIEIVNFIFWRRSTDWFNPLRGSEERVQLAVHYVRGVQHDPVSCLVQRDNPGAFLLCHLRQPLVGVENLWVTNQQTNKRSIEHDKSVSRWNLQVVGQKLSVK